MATVTFSASDLRRVLRSANTYGNKLIIRRGRCNGVFVWLSADESYRRTLHSNLLKSSV